MAHTLFFLNAAASGSSHGNLQVDGSGPATATTATGWTVGKTASSNYSELAFGTSQLATTFTTTVQPGAAPATTDCWRTASKWTGTFAATSWALAVAFIAAGATVAGGNLRCRVFRSTSATGASAVEVTASPIAFSAVSSLTTSTAQNTTASWSPGAVVLAGEYLFFELAWQITSASSSNSSAVRFRLDATNSKITTPTFAAAASFANTVPVAQVFGRTATLTEPTLTDTIGAVGSSLATSKQSPRPTSDTVSVSTALASSLVTSRGLSDGLTVGGALGRSVADARPSTDSISPSTSLSPRASALLRALANSTTPSTSIGRGAAVHILLADEIEPPTNGSVRVVAASRTQENTSLADELALSNALSWRLTTARGASDSVSITESLGRSWGPRVDMADAIVPASDVMTRGSSAVRAIADSAIPAASLARLVFTLRPMTASLSLSDSLAVDSGAGHPGVFFNAIAPPSSALVIVLKLAPELRRVRPIQATAGGIWMTGSDGGWGWGFGG